MFTRGGTLAKIQICFKIDAEGRKWGFQKTSEMVKNGSQEWSKRPRVLVGVLDSWPLLSDAEPFRLLFGVISVRPNSRSMLLIHSPMNAGRMPTNNTNNRRCNIINRFDTGHTTTRCRWFVCQANLGGFRCGGRALRAILQWYRLFLFSCCVWQFYLVFLLWWVWNTTGSCWQIILH